MASPGQSQTQVEVTERDPNDGRRHVDEEIWHKGREPQEEAEQQHVLLLGLPPRAQLAELHGREALEQRAREGGGHEVAERGSTRLAEGAE